METIPQPLTPAQAARQCSCGQCWARPGTPCQQSPEGDHLARYMRARRRGLIDAAGLRAVIENMVVLAVWMVVSSPCRSCYGDPHDHPAQIDDGDEVCATYMPGGHL